MKRFILICILVFLGFTKPLMSGHGNRFVLSQLKYDGDWDPYPQIYGAIFDEIEKLTDIPVYREREIVTLNDDRHYEYPFLLVMGNSELRLTEEQKQRLRRFIDRGGFVFFDDSLADTAGPFGRSVKTLMEQLYPSRSFYFLPPDHAVYRSFFLLRKTAGRKMSRPAMEGLDIGGQGGGENRTAVIYCPNDLMGSWMKDNLGQYLFPCEPGGELQRWEAFKLTINVIYFSLTGTYKKDAVHQPFIEQKLGY